MRLVTRLHNVMHASGQPHEMRLDSVRGIGGRALSQKKTSGTSRRRQRTTATDESFCTPEIEAYTYFVQCNVRPPWKSIIHVHRQSGFFPSMSNHSTCRRLESGLESRRREQQSPASPHRTRRLVARTSSAGKTFPDASISGRVSILSAIHRPRQESCSCLRVLG